MSSPKIIVMGFQVKGIDTTEIQEALSYLSPWEIPAEYLHCVQLTLVTGETFRVKKEEFKDGVDQELLTSIIDKLDIELHDVIKIEVIIDLLTINTVVKQESKALADALFNHVIGEIHGDPKGSN